MSNEKNIQPFDLDAALRGDLVQLRDGRTAQVVACNEQADERHAIIGWVDGIVSSWHKSGAWTKGAIHERDIIGMAPKKVKRWIVISPRLLTLCSNTYDAYAFSSQELAENEKHGPHADWLGPFEIEVEE